MSNEHCRENERKSFDMVLCLLREDGNEEMGGIRVEWAVGQRRNRWRL